MAPNIVFGCATNEVASRKVSFVLQHHRALATRDIETLMIIVDVYVEDFSNKFQAFFNKLAKKFLTVHSQHVQILKL